MVSRREFHRRKAEDHRWWRALRATGVLPSPRYDGLEGFADFMREVQCVDHRRYGDAPIAWRTPPRGAYDLRWVHEDHKRWLTVEDYLKKQGLRPRDILGP